MISDNDLSKKLSEISHDAKPRMSDPEIEFDPSHTAMPSTHAKGNTVVDVADVPVLRHAFRDLDVHRPTPVALTVSCSGHSGAICGCPVAEKKVEALACCKPAAGLAWKGSGPDSPEFGS
jgi:hypothetical protein